MLSEGMLLSKLPQTPNSVINYYFVLLYYYPVLLLILNMI